MQEDGDLSAGASPSMRIKVLQLTTDVVSQAPRPMRTTKSGMSCAGCGMSTEGDDTASFARICNEMPYQKPKIYL